MCVCVCACVCVLTRVQQKPAARTQAERREPEARGWESLQLSRGGCGAGGGAAARAPSVKGEINIFNALGVIEGTIEVFF